jgi:hypothetical protein
VIGIWGGKASIPSRMRRSAHRRASKPGKTPVAKDLLAYAMIHFFVMPHKNVLQLWGEVELYSIGKSL